MSSLGDELRLLIFMAVQALVLIGAWRFVTRFRGDWLQRAIDTLLLTYLIEYAAVMLPGAVGYLSPITMLATAAVIAIALAFTPSLGIPGEDRGGGRVPLDAGPHPNPPPEYRERGPVLGLLFVTGYVLSYAWTQRLLPPLGTDALTYHLPAAMHWLEAGRLERFQTWFFNPANTYSPLAGSAWYAWLLGPIGNDALAIHAPAPMVLLLFLAAVAIGRSLGASTLTAVLAAIAISLCRPVVNQLDKGKDDLFLVAFFAVAVAGIVAPKEDRLRLWRIGVAVGLCLAIKYTAILAMPMLLLAVRRPTLRGGAILAGCTTVIAGPWYLTNWIQCGNPLFPTDFLFFTGLFSSARSIELRSLDGILGVIVTGPFAIPGIFVSMLAIGWLTATLPLPSGERAGVRGETLSVESRTGLKGRSPLTLAFSPPGRGGKLLILLGPLVGAALFLLLSPYPEVRFLLPTLLLLTMALNLVRRYSAILAAVAAVAALATSISEASLLLPFVGVGALLAAIGFGLLWMGSKHRSAGYGSTELAEVRRPVAPIVVLIVALAIAGYDWVNWHAFLDERRDIAGAAWTSRGMPGDLWTFVRDEIPPGSTIAYTGTHLVYPLMDGHLVVYVPVRKGVTTIADLPRLGDHLSGEQINPAMQQAMQRDLDPAGWATRLRASGAAYLVIATDIPGPEALLIDRNLDRDPHGYRLVHHGQGGDVYQLTWPSPPASPGPGR